MQIDRVLASLGYDQSANYLQGNALETDLDFGHVFRKAQEECNLHGVYVLNGAAFEKSRGSVPTVFVCQASTEQEAREIHRKVWNQDAVPFLLVISTGWVRLYPGFQYERDVTEDPLAGALRVLNDFHHLTSQLGPVCASAIDNGVVWRELGDAVAPDRRVDWQLLDNLKALDRWLEDDGVADRRLAHAMIGKFVYLQYLRQRGILSDNRLAGWGIDPSGVFGHNAKMTVFLDLVLQVDEWLNGSVFPLSQQKIRDEFGAERLRKVASVFHGADASSGQLPLFDIYDFSFIPIETLSVIYEQFLHSVVDPSGSSEGQLRGAYYTPVPLVNYMLDRLDTRRPLKPGMRVLDASSGSGAFLVQCYRKLVERRRQELGRRLRPDELGALLRNHIFGVDVDEDACQIAELSLVLTLLDYVDPPDLTETNWQLPALRDRNIFHANAFNDDEIWFKTAQKHPFQWIVGNPPWKDLKPKELTPDDKPAWEWMLNHKTECPVGGNQLAEAFAWRSAQLLEEGGVSALLLPAMTLFKHESTRFRRSFLSKLELWLVANFANLAETLFAGRARLPAAAIFFTATIPTSDHVIETFSPLVANQVTSASLKRQRQNVWSILVNSSEVSLVEQRDVANGSRLPWKIAMWGTVTDLRVIRSTANRWATLKEMQDAGAVLLSEGPRFISPHKATPENAIQRDDLIGRDTLDVKPLKNRRYLFEFPDVAIRPFPSEKRFLSKRAGVEKKLSVCEPPHVIISESRKFAVYTENFLIVPTGQIGITSPTQNRPLLKALALYLNSDFVAYHDFLTTAQAGIQKSIGTLDALRGVPVPFTAYSDLSDWAKLYQKILDVCDGRDDFNVPSLIQELNELTFHALKLSSRGRAAIDDLVHVRLGLIQGKRSSVALRQPTRDECDAYARMLRDELDGFLNESTKARHRVQVLTGDSSGLVAIQIVQGDDKIVDVEVLEADSTQAKTMRDVRANLIERRAQWLYFDRNLRVYDGPNTYLLKPFQRLHWTRTQAIADAREIIADSLATEHSSHSGVEIV